MFYNNDSDDDEDYEGPDGDEIMYHGKSNMRVDWQLIRRKAKDLWPGDYFAFIDPKLAGLMTFYGYDADIDTCEFTDDCSNLRYCDGDDLVFEIEYFK